MSSVFLNQAYLSRDEKERELFYYEVRDSFNKELPGINFQNYSPGWAERAAKVIFLNRTCYNGLFRVNRNGEFNVPFGRYKNPDILNEENLQRCCTGAEKTPGLYGEISPGAGIMLMTIPLCTSILPTARSARHPHSRHTRRMVFPKRIRIRLAALFRELDAKGAKIMLSNSDPRNRNSHDTFFDDLFSDYTIERVPARRIINCNGTRRGSIDELIITNYPTEKR